MNDIFFNVVVRNLTKYIYKFLHPNSYKHNRRYWPFYQVSRNVQGHIHNVHFRQKLIADHSTEIKILNTSCLLIATGPSSKNIPKNYLENSCIDILGVNGAIAHTAIQFTHYVIIDHDFIENRFDLVKKVLETNCNFFTTARCLDLILKKVSIQQIHCQIRIIEIMSSGKIERFMGNAFKQDISDPDFYFDQNYGFSLNHQNLVFDYYTVAYTALQIIFGLHYKKIYLSGIDLTNLNAPRFYETEQSKQITFLQHHLDSILTAFNTAAQILRKKNVEVYNLSAESLLECFPKLKNNE